MTKRTHHCAWCGSEIEGQDYVFVYPFWYHRPCLEKDRPKEDS